MVGGGDSKLESIVEAMWKEEQCGNKSKVETGNFVNFERLIHFQLSDKSTDLHSAAF